MTDKWDERFVALAEHLAQWSKDPSTGTGAVIVRPDRSICSTGYNGFPRGILDTKQRLNDRDTKYELIIHCEMNAVMTAKESVQGYTLYTFPFHSCPRCAVHMIQAGISRVVAPLCPKDKEDRWKPLLQRSFDLFYEAGVEVVFV